ncbi:MAG: tetratricopeptide repeat protein [Vicinamibacterales bacterium]
MKLGFAAPRVAVFVAVLATSVVAPPAWAQAVGARSPEWLVVPFEVVNPSPRTYWLGEGAAVLLEGELTRLGIGVFSRPARIAALDEFRLPTSRTLTRATHIRVGALLGASAAIFGTMAVDADTLRITAQRLELDAARFGPEITEEGKLTDLVIVATRVAERLARGAGVTPVGAAAQAEWPPLESFEAYVKALLTDRPDARVRLLQSALGPAPAFDLLRLTLWEALTDLDEHARALAILDGVKPGAATYRTAQFHRALSLIELKRLDDAFAALRSLADERADSAVMNNLGVIQLRRGWTPQTGRATYYLTRAAEIDADDPDVCFNLGYAYWTDGEPAAAIYWLREAVRRTPADADAHLVLSAALEAVGAGPEASRERQLAQNLSARYGSAKAPGEVVVPRGLERVKNSLAQWLRVRFDVALRQAAQRNQAELVEFHLQRAIRLIEQHRDGDAEPELRRVLFLSPYHAQAHLLVGQVYSRVGRATEAIAAYRISLWSEESAAAHVALAEALLETRDVAAAGAAVQRALELEPESVAARALAARLNGLPK